MHRLIALIVLVVVTVVSATASAEPIKIALNWVPEPEFGGIYAAQQSGIFRANGLDVEILPGGAGAPNPIAMLAERNLVFNFARDQARLAVNAALDLDDKTPPSFIFSHNCLYAL